MADDGSAGVISAELRLKLDEMEKDALAAQKRMEHFAKEFAREGEKGGKLYVTGFNKGAADLNKRLNQFVGNLSGISPKMGALGDKIAKVFSKPIFAMIPMVSAAFQAMLPVIGTIIAAIAAIIAVISKAAKAQKEFSDNVRLAGRASDALKGKTTELNAEQQKSAEITARQERNSATMRVAFKKLGDFFSGVFLPIINSVRDAFTAIGDAVSWVADKLGIVSTEEAEAAANAQKLKEQNASLTDSFTKYNIELRDIATAEKFSAKTAEEATNSRLSAVENYLSSLITLRNETAALVGETSKEVAAYDEAIKKQVTERDSLRALIDGYEALRNAKKEEEKEDIQAKINAEREAAIAKYEQAVRRANDAYEAGLIDEIELHKQLETALATEYSDLEAIVVKYKLSEGITANMRDTIAEQVKLNQDIAKAKENQKTIDQTLLQQSDTLLEQEIERMKAMAEAAESEDEKNRYMRQAIDLENDLILLQRKREWDALEQSEAYKAASDTERKKILDDFDAITAGLMKIQEEKKKTAKVSIFDSDAWTYGMAIGQAAVSAFDSISSQALAISQKHAEEQIAIIDAALERTMEQIEQARQMELEAEGFIEAQSEEQIQKQIDAAKQAGDEILQYQLQRRLKEKEINARYDAQAIAAEKKAAKEKAQIEYDAAKEEFAMKMIQAVNAGIMAVLEALASAPPPYNFVLAGISGAAATVQIGMLAANPPRPPAFADGGIVPGRKADGDTRHIIATAGELILNEAQQENVADKLPGGEIVVNTFVVVNDEVIGKSTARYANTKGAVFEQRAVMGLR
jgi:hypothetical protein